MYCQNKYIAVVGCGYWGKNLVRNFAQLGVLRVICDASYTTVKLLSEQFDVPCVTDFQQVLSLPEVQAVVIATPAPTHADLVMQALAAGKDVFVEKPLALTLDDALAIQTLANKSERLLMVGHLLEYHPALVTLRQLVADGKLGKLQYLYSNRLSFGKVRTEENVLWSFAPHDICNILGFTGELPRRVQAFGSSFDRVEDFCTINLEFANNIKAHIFVSWLHPFKEHRLVVVGDRAMVVFDDVSTEAKLCLYPQQVEFQGHLPILHKDAKQIIPLPQAEPLLLECQHFLHCVQNRQQPITGIKNGIDVLTILESAQASLTTHGNMIDLKEKCFVS
ncbi:Gfo/Idh/MocA family oxidoreductase [Gloeocapsa sp. BRSZ]